MRLEHKDILLEEEFFNQTYGETCTRIVYADGTYRCSHWKNTSDSEWQLIDDVFWYRHAHNGPDAEFRSDPNGSALGMRIIGAIIARELLT